MQTLLFQDFITITGPSGSADIVQTDTAWLGCQGVEELVFWLDLRGVSGTVALRYETAPAKESPLFTSMVPALDLGLLGVNTVTVTPALANLCYASAAGWVRWRVGPTAAGAWSATFRIWVAMCANRRM